MLSFDTETHLFGPTRMAPKVVCASLVIGATPAVLLASDAAPLIRDRLRRCLEIGEPVVGQNIAYDFSCLLEHYADDLGPLIWQVYDRGLVRDTMLQEQLLDIAEGRFRTRKYDLESIAELRAPGFPISKDNPWRTRFAELDGVPVDRWPDAPRDYAIGDAAVLPIVYAAQLEKAQRTGYDAFDAVSSFEARAAFALNLMRCWGVKVDTARATAWRDRLKHDALALEPQLRLSGVMRDDGTLDRKLQQRLVESTWAGEGPVPRTDPTTMFPNGQVKTDAETLEQCDHPALRAVVLRSGLEKARSTYADLFCESGGIIHPGYNALGAESGRTSSSKPPIQNMSREEGPRECLVARDGTALVTCDYDAQEMRMWAEACYARAGFSTLGDRFAADPNFDPHSAFAAERLGMTYDDVVARRETDDRIGDARFRAKAANFGFPGGMGATKFRLYARGYGLELSQEECEKIREDWFRAYPEARPYFGYVSSVTRDDDGTVDSLYSGFRRGGLRFSQCANHDFQHLGSRASKTAAYEVARRCYGDRRSPLWGCRPNLFVHDEIGLEAPIEHVHEAAMALEEVMVEAQQAWTPKVPARASAKAMLRLTKKAKRVMVDGRLQVWAPKGAA